jgi:hypothetical protein
MENNVEQKYDGDGHPLKTINSTQTVETTPPSSPVVEVKYQIWSSVMNTTLTELRENGSKAETKVFAGGAVIAKQYDNPQTPDFVRWLHADPVTGSRQEVQKNGVGEDWLRTELEPLGQEIQPIKPDEEFPTGVTASNFSADSPEWLCQNPNVNYDDMPVGCQRAKNEDVTKFMFPEEEGNAAEIDKQPSAAPAPSQTIADSGLIMSFKRKASMTTKPMKDDDKKPVIKEDVEVKISFDDEIFSGFQGAESGAQQETIEQRRQRLFDEAVLAVRGILGASNSCSKFFGDFGLTAFNEGIRNATFGELDNINNGIKQQISIPTYHKSRLPVLGEYNNGTYYDHFTANSYTVNTRGAFFNSVNTLPRFGGYNAGSLQSRVLQLLHELGHQTIKGTSTRGLVRDIVNRGFVRGELLLKEDGGDSSLSETNTTTVLNNCRNQIDALVNPPPNNPATGN